MWRITDDFWDEWPLLYNMFERAEKWCTHTGVSKKGGQYVAVFNTDDEDSDASFDLSELEIYDKVSGIELWSGDKVEFEKKLSFKIKSHGAKVYYFK